MAVDYDLIIMGATPVGFQAAIAAATLKARVALITQGISPRHAPEAIPLQAIRYLAHQSGQPSPKLSLAQSLPRPWQWNHPLEWLDAVVGNIEAGRSDTVLAYRGVDVIPMMGAFCRKPVPGVMVGDRFLHARGYLLMMDTRPAIPAIAGLHGVGFLTPETVPDQVAAWASGHKVVIVGADKTAVDLAQILTRLGMQVIILTPQPALLPICDREVAQLIQAQLEAEGVQIWLNTAIDQVRSRAGQKQLLLGNTILTTDEIIVATGQTPNLGALNLEAVGVQWDDQGIPHRPTLQTSNPRIYACEGRVGLECFASLATQEAEIALKNILFFPWHRIERSVVPLAIQVAPEAAWVGLTADAAIQQYGQRQVYVLRQAVQTLPQAQIRDDLTGFCKLIVHRNGTLLGAHVVSAQASEAIGILALAMQQRLKISAISSLALPSPTLAELVPQTAREFQRQHLKHTLWQQDLIDNFFDLRRAWSRNKHK